MGARRLSRFAMCGSPPWCGWYGWHDRKTRADTEDNFRKPIGEDVARRTK
jgi:hypothetical protein